MILIDDIRLCRRLLRDVNERGRLVNFIILSIFCIK